MSKERVTKAVETLLSGATVPDLVKAGALWPGLTELRSKLERDISCRFEEAREILRAQAKKQ